MSKRRKIILIILFNISIMLWLTLVYSVLHHKEDENLVNYKPTVVEKKEPKKAIPEIDSNKDDENQDF
mgnify:CR=1 FL=1